MLCEHRSLTFITPGWPFPSPQEERGKHATYITHRHTQDGQIKRLALSLNLPRLPLFLYLEPLCPWEQECAVKRALGIAGWLNILERASNR